MCRGSRKASKETACGDECRRPGARTCPKRLGNPVKLSTRTRLGGAATGGPRSAARFCGWQLGAVLR